MKIKHFSTKFLASAILLSVTVSLCSISGMSTSTAAATSVGDDLLNTLNSIKKDPLFDAANPAEMAASTDYLKDYVNTLPVTVVPKPVVTAAVGYPPFKAKNRLIALELALRGCPGSKLVVTPNDRFRMTLLSRQRAVEKIISRAGANTSGDPHYATNQAYTVMDPPSGKVFLLLDRGTSVAIKTYNVGNGATATNAAFLTFDNPQNPGKGQFMRVYLDRAGNYSTSGPGYAGLSVSHSGNNVVVRNSKYVVALTANGGEVRSAIALVGSPDLYGSFGRGDYGSYFSVITTGGIAGIYHHYDGNSDGWALPPGVTTSTKWTTTADGWMPIDKKSDKLTMAQLCPSYDANAESAYQAAYAKQEAEKAQAAKDFVAALEAQQKKQAEAQVTAAKNNAESLKANAEAVATAEAAAKAKAAQEKADAEKKAAEAKAKAEAEAKAKLEAEAKALNNN